MHECVICVGYEDLWSPICHQYICWRVKSIHSLTDIVYIFCLTLAIKMNSNSLYTCMCTN